MKGFLIGIVVLVALVAGYFAIVTQWSYSTGERAGWVQKFSNKGWLCKTVAEKINKVVGQRVSLHYEEKVGLPTTCFGETRYYVTDVSAMGEVTPGHGVVPPTSPGAPASAASAR